MSKSRSNDPNSKVQRVRVARCQAASCSGSRGSERAAAITFSHHHQFLGPFALALAQVRILIADLQQVLIDWSEPEVGVDGRTQAPRAENSELPLPPKPDRPGSSKGRMTIKPSRGANCPRSPIGPKEVWLVHNLLKNVKTHADFMRLIGVDQSAADGARPATTPKKRK